jgi:hypothetical protein
VGSDVAISERLRRLADQVCHLPREMAARSDGLMVIHDELLESAVPWNPDSVYE